jgi:membrane protein YqaA with SNARE-associated domain
MGRLASKAYALAVAFGAPGLFLVAFLDSSFLSLPEIADILVVSMVTRSKSRALVYIVCATIGSLAGSLIMYFIGKKGGAAWVKRRFASGSVDRAMKAFERHGTMAVLIPSILPPPAPFKIFVLLAGVAGISTPRFALAILLGRGARYAILGLLAVRYGDEAMAYMHAHGTMVSLIVVGVLVAGFLGYLLWSKRRRAAADTL